jgi:hypothetical protein
MPQATMQKVSLIVARDSLDRGARCAIAPLGGADIPDKSGKSMHAERFEVVLLQDGNSKIARFGKSQAGTICRMNCKGGYTVFDHFLYIGDVLHPEGKKFPGKTSVGYR